VSRGEAPLDAAAIRRRIARREALLWASAFGWPALRVLVLGTLLGIGIVMGMSEMMEPLGEEAASGDVLAFGVRYGLMLTTVPAVWAGLSSLAFRLARGWAVVPALTLPSYVAVACWIRQDELRASATALSHAVSAQLDAHGLETAQVIATQSGVPTAADVPALMAHAGASFFDDHVRTALDALDHEVVITLVVSLVPGVLVSLLALSVGYRRGWRVRHEADLERLRQLEPRPGG
jgi:hypothetical protein